MNIDIKDVKIQAMLSAIRSGSDLETACHYAEISVIEVYKWLERGKNSEIVKPKHKTEQFYIAIWRELAKARADAIVRNVAHIQKAAQDGDWKAAAWWLEKTMPETYAKKPTRQINSKQKEINE